jgi:hypothetical protein
VSEKNVADGAAAHSRDGVEKRGHERMDLAVGAFRYRLQRKARGRPRLEAFAGGSWRDKRSAHLGLGYACSMGCWSIASRRARVDVRHEPVGVDEARRTESVV